MAQQWHPFQTMFRPALPPARLTADVYETAGGEAYVLEIPVPGLSAEDITIDANADRVTVAIRRQPDKVRPGATSCASSRNDPRPECSSSPWRSTPTRFERLCRPEF